MLKGMKVECWDIEDSHGSIELDMDEEEEKDCQVLHLEIPMLKGGKVISVFLNDLEAAITLLKQG